MKTSQILSKFVKADLEILEKNSAMIVMIIYLDKFVKDIITKGMVFAL
jgi:hypothetical protein